jgi:hypothetical protein
LVHLVDGEGSVHQLQHERRLSGRFIFAGSGHEQHGSAGNGGQGNGLAVLP